MLESKVESILFISSKPLTLASLAKAVGAGKAEVEVVIEQLKQKHNTENSGIQIVQSGEDVQMVSSPANSDIVGKFLNEEILAELTRPQLETLTVIAYRSPITKLELETIRGVNCSLILRNLAIKGLIEVEENKIVDNNEYRLSIEFMKHLGINDPSELPDFEELSKAPMLEETISNNEVNND